ncbi:MAG: hypothetical protein HYX50_05070 [Chloroflexi bacterium]|nr:hypothetical protein [Chloroflexota bacterium]
MTCQDAWAAYQKALANYTSITDKLKDYAARIGSVLMSRPQLLLGGEVNSWQRYSREAEHAAVEHHAALERYLEAARTHTNGDPAGA